MDFNINFSQLTKSEKTHIYIEHMTPLLNRAALFSDGTNEYRIPAEPMPNQNVTIRFRTAKDNVDSVILVYNNEKFKMTKTSTDKMFDYYEYKVLLGEQNVYYYFIVEVGKTTCYYNARGVMDNYLDYYNFCIMPGYKTPDWAKGAVFYQIFVDRFYNGDKNNDVETNEYVYIGEKTSKVDDWNKYPAAMGVREFYGGDLQGVIDKLDYLQDLGIDAIYLNPIFVSPSNHKYDIQDYDYVDPHLGKIVKDEGKLLDINENSNKDATRYITRVTDKENLEASNELFIKLVKEIHKRGMKIILDGVFNHCGSFNKWLDKEQIYENQKDYKNGAYISEDSPYNTFFKFRESEWPYNNKYDGWWGHDTLPKLNYEDSPKLYEYIMGIAKKWVSPPFNVDGWRLDVAADLGHSSEYNHKFWKDFRKVVKAANPNAIILAEHYGDPSSWLQGDEWDTIMNYDAFMEPLTWFLTGVEKHSDEFRGDLIGNSDSFFNSMGHYMASLNTQSLQVSMNELSNHDHSRFLTRTNKRVGRTSTMGPKAAEEGINKGIFRQGVIMQMTWVGAPTIYYGDEAGVCGWTDPDNRRTYPWGHEDLELIKFHKDIIRIHKSYEVFKTGSLIFLGGERNYICYGRFNKDDKIVVAFNCNQDIFHAKINVWQLGLTDGDRMATMMTTTEDGYSLSAKIYNVKNGAIKLTMPKMSAIIIKNINIY